jgi:hypothetical protein
MHFPVAVLQTLSAFVIFVAGYLILMASIICVSVLASFIYTSGRFMKAYAARNFRHATPRIASEAGSFDGGAENAVLRSDGGVL